MVAKSSVWLRDAECSSKTQSDAEGHRVQLREVVCGCEMWCVAARDSVLLRDAE